MTDSAHLSIGEVLTLVQADFPDVTISKIRFLESQGLLDPERTPSGYRKFHDSDIDRLQWILGQQRDNFLPLKVIRERLDEWDETGTPPGGDAIEADATEVPPTVGTSEPTPQIDPVVSGPVLDDAVVDQRSASASLAAASAMEVLPPPPAPVPPSQPIVTQPETEATVPSSDIPVATTSAPDSQYTALELAARAGVPIEVVAELESFSMIASRRIGAETYYDQGAVAVAAACRRFLDEGVEVRHLRMYKIAAEREAGMFEQLVVPLLKQRNPEARARAVAMVESLSEAGEAMHSALLHQALSDTLP